jgi:hypothetical protein
MGGEKSSWERKANAYKIPARTLKGWRYKNINVVRSCGMDVTNSGSSAGNGLSDSVMGEEFLDQLDDC